MNKTDDATMNMLGQLVADKFLSLSVPQEWFIESLPSTGPVLDLSAHCGDCALCLAQRPCPESDELELVARWTFTDQLIESLQN